MFFFGGGGENQGQAVYKQRLRQKEREGEGEKHEERGPRNDAQVKNKFVDFFHRGIRNKKFWKVKNFQDMWVKS